MLDGLAWAGRRSRRRRAGDPTRAQVTREPACCNQGTLTCLGAPWLQNRCTIAMKLSSSGRPSAGLLCPLLLMPTSTVLLVSAVLATILATMHGYSAQLHCLSSSKLTAWPVTNTWCAPAAFTLQVFSTRQGVLTFAGSFAGVKAVCSLQHASL